MDKKHNFQEVFIKQLTEFGGASSWDTTTAKYDNNWKDGYFWFDIANKMER